MPTGDASVIALTTVSVLLTTVRMRGRTSPDRPRFRCNRSVPGERAFGASDGRGQRAAQNLRRCASRMARRLRSSVQHFTLGLVSWLGENLVPFVSAFSESRFEPIGSIGDAMNRNGIE